MQIPGGILAITTKEGFSVFDAIQIDNKQLLFQSNVTLQLVVDNSDTPINLANELIDFLASIDNDPQGSIFQYGEGSELENSFISDSENQSNDIISETYEEGDIINPSGHNLTDNIEVGHNCLFSCGSVLFSTGSRASHHWKSHKNQYQELKEKFTDSFPCPYCQNLITGIKSLTRHINLHHQGKTYYDF